MSDHEEIRGVIGRYCWAADHGGWDEWLGLFTEDGEWSGRPGTVKGRAALTELSEKLAKGNAETIRRHYPLNQVIDIDGDKARLRFYMMLAQPSTKQIASMSDVEVDLVKQGGRWLMRRMSIENLT